jgi:MinD superfamily P-loop ATPase
VIASIGGASAVLIVAEPTVSGNIYQMNLVCKSIKSLLKEKKTIATTEQQAKQILNL